MRPLLACLALLLLVGPACTEDTRPPGDGAVSVDSGRRDSAPADTSTGDASDSGGGDYNYCPGSEPNSIPACRIDTDCECGMCSLGSICGGVGCAAECGSDDDCTDGWCATGCCPYCVPSCPTTACAAGTRCDEATGRCNRIPCDDPEGQACTTNFRCVDGGCRRIECATDTDCDCGTCAQGGCYDRPGQCCPPLPG
ncbi:MAG: hypothetical protein JRH11_09385 [Deltaproteobacteria bacterium]|nr:hypothetical protein [Deltaproteobacteria bacterium]